MPPNFFKNSENLWRRRFNPNPSLMWIAIPSESEYIPSDSDSDYEDSETDDDTVTEDLSFLDANKIIV